MTNRLKRFGFRFVFLYFILYNLPFPLGVIPNTYFFAWKYNLAWQGIAAWVAAHVLHVGYSLTFVEHSGDTTYRYVVFLCELALALPAAALWTWLGSEDADEERLYDWLRVYIRLALATQMIEYGAVKVFQAQFAPLRPSQLLETYGEASPMGLLWTFMGYSRGYNLFTGSVEVLGGVLLVVPRLAALGALVSAGAIANVLMLNLCYDVPVKLKCFHLLAECGVLLAPDLRRLTDFFVFNRPVEPAEERPLFWRSPEYETAALVLQLIFGVFLLESNLRNAHQRVDSQLAQEAKTPFRGIWSVEELSAGGQAEPAEASAGARWRRVILDFPGSMRVQTVGGGNLYFKIALDTAKRVMSLERMGQPRLKSELGFKQPESGILVLDGNFEGRKLHARLRRFDESKLQLLSRGFHWISEEPYNR